MAYTGKGEGTAITVGGSTLSDLKTICQYHGWHDGTTAGLAALRNFINRTLQLLSILAPWPEYHKRDGTISVTQTDYDITLSPTNIAQVGNIYRSGKITPLILIPDGVEGWLHKYTISSSQATPTEYALRKSVNSSGEIEVEILLYHVPAASETLYFCYRLLPTKLVNNSDVCDWPDSRLWLLDEALDIRLNSGKKDASGLALESADFMGKVRKAMSDTRSSYMPMPVREATDWRKRTIREVPIQVTV